MYKLRIGSMDQLNIATLSRNPHPAAIKLLQQHLAEINWWWFVLNTCDEAIKMFKEKQHPVDTIWSMFAANPNPEAFELLKDHFDKVGWSYQTWYFLSENTSPQAMQLLKENKDNINWSLLSGNPSDEAIKMLKDNEFR